MNCSDADACLVGWAMKNHLQSVLVPDGLHKTLHPRSPMRECIWLASIVMKTNDQQGTILNVIVSGTGALIAGYFLAPMAGTGTINNSDFSASSLLLSPVGAVILLAIVTARPS